MYYQLVINNQIRNMQQIEVVGGKPLNGTIVISGAKNAALPIMAAALLCNGKLTIGNMPDLADTGSMTSLLQQHGVIANVNGKSSVKSGSKLRSIELDASKITSYEAPYEIVRTMRASVLVLGPLVARFGRAKVSLPGGCAIGTRPVDMHIEALKKLGAEVTIQDGYIHAFAQKGLTGAEVVFDKVSVGATENTLTAATLAKGKTVIKNAAKEPEIVDLANCLIAMGAKIKGAGTDTIEVEGVDELHSALHTLIGDRIEAGTYAVAAAITGGQLELEGIDPKTLSTVLDVIEATGTKVTRGSNSISINNVARAIKALNVSTNPYPEFPTDMQAQLMALLCLSSGVSEIRETVFENRFMHVPELIRMGANVAINDNSATVTGVNKLSGAQVMASDLRASVSLILAGLAAEGKTTLNRAYHLFRGYEDLVGKLNACGANVKRIRESSRAIY